MQYLLLLFLILTNFQVQSQVPKKQHSYLKLSYCAYENTGNLGLDTLLLLDGFHFESLEKRSKKPYRIFDYQISEKGNCTHYELLLKQHNYHYFFVNSYTFDTLFLDVNLVHDTFIDLNELSDHYYKKHSPESLLLKDLKAGDKISFTYNYYDCPPYNGFYNVTFKALNATEFICLNTQKSKPKKSPKIKLEALLSFEKEVRKLKKGKGLEIQIRKNDAYQVFKCRLKDPNQLPVFLKEFLSK